MNHVGVKRQASTGGVGVVTARLRAAFDVAPDGTQRLALAGSIDENADLDSIFSKLTGDTVLNLRGIDRVNSMGVHRWVPIVTAFTARHRLLIEEISYALVQNANFVANLFGSATVVSCIAPYYCSTCKDNCSVTVTGEEVAAHGFEEPPSKRCVRCNSVMEFDELDGYFAFFKSRSRR